jgi:hypothetical protein
MRRALFALILGIATAPAVMAGGAYNGIARPVYYQSALYLDVSAMEKSSRPACAVRDYVRLIEAENDPGFQRKYALIVGAWLAEKRIAFAGTGSCTGEGDEVVYIVAGA